ncbi:MAG TPA: tripartite tricarboxylate transporter substrate binding protein [Casimicrobiaceae bacterium]|jgi:tripartite-type tricarboxylate transporter receptor subunit TctC|nr:tripartite tricarboxylate transporter substrate binding protein [Casimicrobiaceae bacterium]
MNVSRRGTIGLVLCALAAVSLGATAQTYPTRPVRLIVADAPGGAPDQLARLLGQKLSTGLGQQVVVDNRPGAGGVLGADLAAKAPADGYTLLMTTTAIYAILPNLKKNLPYDPAKDFVPISRIATASNVLVVNNAVPAKNVAELVKLAKEKPGTLNYGSAGIGTPAHLAGEMLNLLADIKVTHVPYKGAAPALQDVIAGNVQYIITSPIAAGAHMSSGRVRALATTGAMRNPSLPELPTIAETVPGYEITQSWGIVAPAGTPPEIVHQLAGEIHKAMNEPDVKEQVLKTGAVPAGDSPAEFEAFMAKERQRLGEVITRSGIVLTD